MKTKEERKAIHFNLVNKLSGHLGMLWGRWCGERGYEDIIEYGKVLKPAIEKCGVTFLSMSKRPFGFKYQINGEDEKYIMSCTSKKISIKQIKG